MPDDVLGVYDLSSWVAICLDPVICDMWKSADVRVPIIIMGRVRVR